MQGFKRDNLFPLILHWIGETSNTLGKQLYLLIPTNLQLESRKERKMTFKPVITHFHWKWPLESFVAHGNGNVTSASLASIYFR